MKKIAFTAVCIALFTGTSQAQNTFPPTGNAGIGTTAPAANLQINGGYSNNGCTNYTGQPAINILWSTPDNICAIPGPTGTIPDAFRIVRPNYTFPPYSESPIMVLNGEGKLGLGIAPNSLYRINVLGQSYFNGNANVKGNLSLLQTNTSATPSISANNADKGLNIFSNTNATDGAYLEMYGKDHSDTARKGSIRFISYGISGEGFAFLNYNPSLSTWKRTMTITNDNKVYIGNAKPSGQFASYKLGVDGDFICKRAVVQITDWADFVFKSDYKLMPLEEVASFIKENKHLPNIPSEKTVLENGMDVSEMNKLLLQKIEELTLYMIELKKENESIKAKLGRQ